MDQGANWPPDLNEIEVKRGLSGQGMGRLEKDNTLVQPKSLNEKNGPGKTSAIE